MNMFPPFPPSLLASRRQTACFAQTVDIRDKTQAGFAQIVGIILQQTVTKVFLIFECFCIDISSEQPRDVVLVNILDHPDSEFAFS